MTEKDPTVGEMLDEIINHKPLWCPDNRLRLYHEIRAQYRDIQVDNAEEIVRNKVTTKLQQDNKQLCNKLLKIYNKLEELTRICQS